MKVKLYFCNVKVYYYLSHKNQSCRPGAGPKPRGILVTSQATASYRAWRGDICSLRRGSQWIISRKFSDKAKFGPTTYVYNVYVS